MFAPAYVPLRNKAEVEHGRPLPPLELDECEQRNRSHHERADDARRSPAIGVRLDQPVREGEEAERRGREPREIEPHVRFVLRLGDQQQAGHDRDNADGDVHEEDPVPAQVLGQQAADERADREGERSSARPDADRCTALARRERRGDDRKRRRIHQRCPRALDDARGDQHFARAGEPAPERREREDDDPENEDQPPAVGVRELAADQHQGGERERIAGHDPLECRKVGLEVTLDRGQGDVHDGVVEHDHEKPERDGPQRPPLPALL